MKETITRLSERDYLHGERLTLGNRTAEVVRAYVGAWHCFTYIDGKQLVTWTDAPSLSYSQAFAEARRFVREVPSV